MANNDIKQKIVLEGEKQYRDAIKDAQRNLKTLRSELKAETAEMGRNATEQQKAEAKVKSLKNQIAEQEKIVKANRDALEEVRKKYADNEDAIAKYEQKLNDSRTALANMKNELDGVGQSLQKVGNSSEMGVVAANSFADSLGKISDVGGSVSDAIEETFKKVAGHITEAISELWGELMDVAARANNWNDIATMWNSTAGNIQKWYHAVGAEAKDFSKLSNMVTKIVTGDQKKITEASSVSAENYADQWEYAMAVMDSLSGMSTDDAMKALEEMGIKGAKQEGWIDMLKSWQDIRSHLDEFDAENGGMGLTDDEIEKADKLSKSVASLQESWTALKDHALVNLFGDLALNITGNLQTIVEAFDEYFKADNEADREAALEKVKANIKEIFESVKTAIEEGIKMLDEIAKDLQKSDDPTEKTIGNLLGGLVSALQWLTEDNMKNVVSALEILASFWLAGRGLQLASKLASVAGNIATIKGFRGLNSLGGFGGTAGVLTGTDMSSAVTSAITASSGSLATTFVSALTSTPGLIGVGIMMMAPLVAKMFGGKTEEEQRAEEIIDMVEPETIGETLTEAVETATNPEKAKKSQDALHEVMWSIFNNNGKLPSTDEEKQTYENSMFKRISDFVWVAIEASREAEEELEREQEELQNSWQQHSEPTENWEYGDDWTIEEILEDLANRSGKAGEPGPDWWTSQGQTTGGNAGNTDGMTSTDARDMTAAVNGMPAAVKTGLNGMKIYMDRTVVGQMVADEVSRQIASQIG